MSRLNVLKCLAMVLALASVSMFHPAWAQESGCIECHTDAEKLNKITTERSRVWKDAADSADRAAQALVTDAFFEDPYHGEMDCIDCHGGDPEDRDFRTVHKGVDMFPSYPPETGICADCHSEPETFGRSLHSGVAGMRETLFQRANPDPAVRAKLESAFGSCRSCHATCGDCHTKRPPQGGGGFYEGHAFISAPPTEESCASCHKTLFSEFSGEVKDSEPDVHFEMGMDCLECHTKEQLHGDGEEHTSMYDTENGPKCLDCHESIYDKDAPNRQVHGTHKGKTSCHVCHAQPYNNCFECHISKPMNAPDKVKRRLALKFGYNNRKDKQRRPENVVTVRHVPVWEKMFEPEIENALCNFKDLPTWKMTTPHNIRLSTPQNKECNSCHGQWDLFLLRKDVAPEELEANRQVVIPPGDVPAAVEE